MSRFFSEICACFMSRTYLAKIDLSLEHVKNGGHVQPSVIYGNINSKGTESTNLSYLNSNSSHFQAIIRNGRAFGTHLNIRVCGLMETLRFPVLKIHLAEELCDRNS